MDSIVEHLKETGWLWAKGSREYFEKNTEGGVLTYYPDDNTLYLGEDSEGYEVNIRNLEHFLILEGLL